MVAVVNFMLPIFYQPPPPQKKEVGWEVACGASRGETARKQVGTWIWDLRICVRAKMGILSICPVEAVGTGGPTSIHDSVLCPQPQPPLPDVLVWMFSGQRRVAWARIPAQDVLFSVVEEERGQDCGKIQSLLLTVRGSGSLETGVGLKLQGRG